METPRLIPQSNTVTGTDVRLKSHRGFGDGDNRSVLINTPVRRMTAEDKCEPTLFS